MMGDYKLFGSAWSGDAGIAKMLILILILKKERVMKLWDSLLLLLKNNIWICKTLNKEKLQL